MPETPTYVPADIAVRRQGAVAQVILGAIRLYQKTLSPALPVFFGPACGCRFTPSCSHYAAEAVRIHGSLAGTWLAARRLVKCTPLHAGGLDPVPAPRCTRIDRSPRPNAVINAA